MAIDPVSSSNPATESLPDSQAFDDAVDNAKLQETMVEGMVKVGGQMVLMPMMNNILKEAQSDE